MCKTRAKRKILLFKQKSQGGKTGLKMLMNVYTKMYTEIHFYMLYKTQKAPPKRSLKNLQQKRKWAVVRIATLTLLARNDVL